MYILDYIRSSYNLTIPTKESKELLHLTHHHDLFVRGGRLNGRVAKPRIREVTQQAFSMGKAMGESWEQVGILS